jgi:circadian clock protein KaiB
MTPWNHEERSESAGHRAAKRKQNYRLRLYITGVTPNSTRALRNIKALCEEHLVGRYDLEVIDIYQQPVRARTDQILAVPTLVKCSPLPVRRFVGDMSRTDTLLSGLDLGPENAPNHENDSSPGNRRRF